MRECAGALPGHRRPRRVVDILVDNFDIDEGVLLRTPHRLGFSDWVELTRLHRPELKYPNFAPRVVWLPADAEEVFELVRHRDIMRHQQLLLTRHVTEYSRE